MDKFLELIINLNKKYTENSRILSLKNDRLNELKSKLNSLCLQETQIKEKLKILNEEQDIIKDFNKITSPFKKACFKKIIKDLIKLYLVYFVVLMIILLLPLNINIEILKWVVVITAVKIIGSDIISYFEKTKEYQTVKKKFNYLNSISEEKSLKQRLERIFEDKKNIEMEQDLLIIEIENLKVQHNELSGIISTINEKRESIIANFEEQINEKFEDNQEIMLRIREKKEGF